MEKRFSIAIDGPSGAGKSTLAKQLAKSFGFIYVDTGAIYRTVGLAAQLAGIDSKDAAGVIALLPSVKIDIGYDDDGSQIMLLGGRNVSAEIRTPKSSIYASDVSAIREVRAFLLDMQRKMAREHDVIMDGRDIGTVVLPDASLKIFLTASAEERARRRWIELNEKGTAVTPEEVLKDIIYRDNQDTTRAAAPLKAAEDSVIVDTTSIDFNGSLELLKGIVRERLSL